MAGADGERPLGLGVTKFVVAVMKNNVLVVRGRIRKIAGRWREVGRVAQGEGHERLELKEKEAKK